MINILEHKNEIFKNLHSFLIIGAMDGVKHDDIFNLLGDRYDYSIIFVEPVPFYFNQLQENVKKLKGYVSCINGVISNINENVIIRYVKPDKINLYEFYYDGCSCVVENGVPKNIFINKITDNTHLDEIEFLSLTVNDVLEMYKIGSIDYIQIDTEGYDERIVKSLDFEKLNIKAIKFEHFYLSGGYYDYFSTKMKEKGFITIIDGENIFSIKEDFLKFNNII